MDREEKIILDIVQEKNRIYERDAAIYTERRRNFSHFDKNEKPVYIPKLTPYFEGWPGKAKNLTLTL